MMRLMRRALLASAILPALATAAAAQSSPGLVTGQVPTAAQWNSYFAAKQDLLGFTPLSTAGGVMTGRLVTAAPTTAGSGFRLPQGAAPTSPVNGDMWVTSAGLFVRVNGSTLSPITGGTPLNTLPIGQGTTVPFANSGPGAYYAAAYGALCDGATQDGPAFRAAALAAYNAGGGWVIGPSGTCVISGDPALGNAGILLRQNVNLMGAGRGATVLKIGSESTVMVRIIESYSRVSNLNITDNHFDLTSGIRIAPQSETQTTIHTEQNFNTVDNVEIFGTNECLTLKPGPTISGPIDSYIYSNLVWNVNCRSNTKGFQLLEGISARGGSGVNRNTFGAIAATGSGTCRGFYLQYGSDNSIFGARFEGIDHVCAESPTNPTALRVDANAANYFYNPTFENGVTAVNIENHSINLALIGYAPSDQDGLDIGPVQPAMNLSRSGVVMARGTTAGVTLLQASRLRILGESAENATITASSLASVTLLLPSLSGTVPSTATSPLSLNATTGAISLGTVTVAFGGTGLTSGTSGGFPYFNSTSTMASSGLMAANGVVYGGGAGTSPATAAAGTNGQFLAGVTGSPPAMVTMSQDCTTTNAGVVTCLKTNNVSFGTAAVVNTGTSGATIPLLNGNNTWSGTNLFSGVATLASPALTGTVTGSDTIPVSILKQQTAATLLGNPTGSTAAVTAFTIQGLTARGTPDATNDKIPIFDFAAGMIKYVTPQGIASSVTAGVTSLNTKTGALVWSVKLVAPTGTYTASTGTVYVIVECLGGGGGGGGAKSTGAAATSGGGGGGAGGFSRVAVAVASATGQTVTLGAGGIAGTNAPGDGGNGGTTSLGTICIANGGSGGNAGTNTTGGSGGLGGVVAGAAGDLTSTGAPGLTGLGTLLNTTVSSIAGGGASSPFGGGGLGVANNGTASRAGTAATGYGSGGSGGASDGVNAAAGAAGSAGRVVITEYLLN